MSFLGEAIKAGREFRGMSLQDVADEAQLSKAHVWDLERGNATNPSVASLFGLAIALNVDAGVLFGLACADLPNAAQRKAA